jgi:hypothetical protein
LGHFCGDDLTGRIITRAKIKRDGKVIDLQENVLQRACNIWKRGDTMTSKSAEENERNLSPPGTGTFKTAATEIYQYYRVNFH